MPVHLSSGTATRLLDWRRECSTSRPASPSTTCRTRGHSPQLGRPRPTWAPSSRRSPHEQQGHSRPPPRPGWAPFGKGRAGPLRGLSPPGLQGPPRKAGSFSPAQRELIATAIAVSEGVRRLHPLPRRGREKGGHGADEGGPCGGPRSCCRKMGGEDRRFMYAGQGAGGVPARSDRR